MTALNKQKLADIRRAAIAVARDGRTDDEWFYYLQCVHHKNVLAMLDELEAAEKRIAELSASHSKLREGMAAIYNAICENGASTSLSTILTFVKRSREESSTAAGIGVKGE